MGKDVLPDYDGIINEDSKGHDKGKERNHVYRIAGNIEHYKGSHKGYGDTDSNPECQAEV